MGETGRKTRFFTSQPTRWGIILAVTALGAIWLRRRGPEPIVRVTTPLEETVPLWYMLSAFPVYGMLTADLVHLLAVYGLEKKSIELGSQMGVLTAISNLRLALRLPVSGHSLLLAYFILRRLLIHVPDQSSAQLECALAMILYAATSYVKVVWWSDPTTVAAGTAVATGLAAVSHALLKGRHSAGR